MKLFKKGVIICSTLSVLLLGGCSSKVDDKAIQAFGESIIEFNNIKSATYILNAAVKMNKNSGKITLEGAFDARKDLQMDLTATIEHKDKKIPKTLNVVMKDYVLYMQMMGNKQTISFASMKPMLEMNQQKVRTKTKLNDEDIKNMKKMVSKTSLKDGELTLEFDKKEIQAELDKQYNKALAGVNVEKMTIDATINQKQMTSGKVMLLMNNTETKEALDITIDFDLKNINEAVKVKEVEVKDYSVAIDGIKIFQTMIQGLGM